MTTLRSAVRRTLFYSEIKLAQARYGREENYLPFETGMTTRESCGMKRFELVTVRTPDGVECLVCR
jgi:hypothetical protein